MTPNGSGPMCGEGRAPVVVATRHDGLGGRLCALMNAMHVAHNLKWPYGFLWPQEPYADAELRFHAVGDPASMFEAQYLKEHFLEEIDLDRFLLADGPALKQKQIDRCRKDATIWGLRVVHWRSPIRLPRYTKEVRLSAYFEQIRFSQELQAVIEHFKRVNLKKHVALHLRRGDIVYGDHRVDLFNGKYIPTGIVHSIVQHLSENGQQPIVITQDVELARRLRSEYSVALPEDIVRLSDLSPRQKALFDILLMSNCSEILGEDSAFSVSAALIGGIALRSAVAYFKEVELADSIEADLASDASSYHPLHQAKEHQYVAQLPGCLSEGRLAHYSRAMALDASNWTYLELYAKALGTRRRFEEIEQILKQGASQSFEAANRDTTNFFQPFGRQPKQFLRSSRDVALLEGTPYARGYHSFVLERLRMNARALAFATEAYLLEPGSALLAARVVHLLLANDAVDQAHAFVEGCHDKYRDIPAFRQLSGSVFVRRREMKGAAAEFRAAFELSPKNYQHAVLAGYYAELAGDGGGARQFVAQAVAGAPGDPTVRFWESKWEQRRGRVDRAIEAIRVAHRLRPGKKLYLERLARLQGLPGASKSQSGPVPSHLRDRGKLPDALARHSGQGRVLTWLATMKSRLVQNEQLDVAPVDMSAPLVIATKYDGLGARLCVLLNAIHVATRLKWPYAFIWPPIPCSAAELEFYAWGDVNSIFASQYLEQHLMIDVDLRKSSWVGGAAISKEQLNACNEGRSSGLRIIHGRSPIALARATEAVDIKECFTQIRFSRELQRVIDLFQRVDLKDYVAIHLRMGDIVYGNHRIELFNEKYTPVAIVRRIIQHLKARGRKVVIVTQDVELSKRLKDEYSIALPTEVVPIGALNPLQNAMFDMLVMSKCREVFGEDSALSQFAAMIGGIPCSSLVAYFKELQVLTAIEADIANNLQSYHPLHLAKEHQYAAQLPQCSLDKRLEHYAKAAEYDPVNWTYVELYVKGLILRRRFSEAEDLLRERSEQSFVEANRDTHDFFYPRWRQAGPFLRSSKRAAEHTRAPYTYAYRSFILERSGFWAEGLKFAVVAQALAPKSALLATRVLHLSIEASAIDDANAFISGCGAGFEDVAAFRHLSGVVFARLGQQRRAAQALAAAFALAPKNHRHAVLAAYYWGLAGEHELAALLVQQAVTGAPNDHVVKYWESRVAEQRGQLHVAIEALRTAHYLRPAKQAYLTRLTKLQRNTERH